MVRTLLLNLGGLRLDLAGTGAADDFVRILFFSLAAFEPVHPGIEILTEIREPFPFSMMFWSTDEGSLMGCLMK